MEKTEEKRSEKNQYRVNKKLSRSENESIQALGSLWKKQRKPEKITLERTGSF